MGHTPAWLHSPAALLSSSMQCQCMSMSMSCKAQMCWDPSPGLLTEQRDTAGCASPTLSSTKHLVGVLIAKEVQRNARTIVAGRAVAAQADSCSCGHQATPLPLLT